MSTKRVLISFRIYSIVIIKAVTGQALVLSLSSLKQMLRNKFLSICNSHRILVAMMMTIESGKDIFVLFFYISKCIWLVLVLTSGYFALTESVFLFSRAFESSLASKGEKVNGVGAPQDF